MHLAQKCHYAVDVFAERMEDKQIHYGLVFVLPQHRDRADSVRARKCSDLNTRSRHGTVEDWGLEVPLASLPSRHVVLLIPRTWLIRQGYLPWWVLFSPYCFFAMRRADALRQHFWLEWPEYGSMEDGEAALKTA
jgi:hypothetical protein